MSKMLIALLAGCTFILRLSATTSPVIISEFMAENDGYLLDSFGNSSDWLELQNTTGRPINLENWSLTDSAKSPAKWLIPAVTLPPWGTLLIWASNADQRDPTKELHTNFALSKSGEYLGLYDTNRVLVYAYAPTFPAQYENVSYGVAVSVSTNTVALVSNTSPVTAYCPADDNLGTVWRQRGFDDSDWASGTLPAGYGTKNPSWVSEVNFSLLELAQGKPGVYLRSSFDLGDAGGVLSLSYNMTYDDGAAVLMFDLSRQLGRYAPRTRWVELFLIGGDSLGLSSANYAGLYVFEERVKAGDDRVPVDDIVSPADTSQPTLSGSYLFKADRLDADEYGWHTPHKYPNSTDRYVVIAYPKLADLQPEQRDFLVNRFNTVEEILFGSGPMNPQTGVSQYIDLPSWADFHICKMFSMDVDIFTLSSWFHKDRSGKIMAGPLWDFDRSLGPYGYSEASFPNVKRWAAWTFASEPFTRSDIWGKLHAQPAFRRLYWDRWAELRQGVFSETNLAATITRLKSELPEAAATRDYTKWGQWPTNDAFGRTHSGEVAWMTWFVTNHAAWIDQNQAVKSLLLKPVAFSQASCVRPAGAWVRVTLTAPEGDLIRYTLDGTDPALWDNTASPSANACASGATIWISSSAQRLERRSAHAGLRRLPGMVWSARPVVRHGRRRRRRCRQPDRVLHRGRPPRPKRRRTLGHAGLHRRRRGSQHLVPPSARPQRRDRLAPSLRRSAGLGRHRQRLPQRRERGRRLSLDAFAPLRGGRGLPSALLPAQRLPRRHNDRRGHTRAHPPVTRAEGTFRKDAECESDASRRVSVTHSTSCRSGGISPPPL